MVDLPNDYYYWDIDRERDLNNLGCWWWNPENCWEGKEKQENEVKKNRSWRSFDSSAWKHHKWGEPLGEGQGYCEGR